MPLPRTAAFVRADGDAWSVVERDTDVAVSEHPSLVAALTALLGLEYFAAIGKGPTFRDGESGEHNGQYRWLDASAEEDESPDGQTQVTADGIRTMAARLCEGDPIMIDGGSADSGAHASADDTSALANGWAYIGVDFEDAAGRTHLALYAELLPEIAKAFDTGRLARGSIFFGHAKDDPGDALLLSHALTNIPAVKGLAPSTAMKARAPTSAVFATRTRRMHMPEKKTPAVTGKRATASEKLNELRTMFAVPAEMTEDWQVACYVGDLFRALMQAAKLDTLLSGGDGGAPAPIAAQAGETREAHTERLSAAARDLIAAAAPPPPAGTDGDAMKAWASDVTAALTSIFGEGDPAALLTKLQASIEAFKGALGNAGGTTPNPDTEGQMSTDAKTFAARELAMQTRLDTATADNAAMRSRLDVLESAEVRREMTAKVDARIVAAKAKPSEKTRTRLIDGAVSVRAAALAAKEDAGKAVDEFLVDMIGPATGEAMPDTLAGSRSSTAADDEKTIEARRTDAVDAELAAIRKERPGISPNSAARAAVKQARTKHPELFGSVTEEN